MQAWSARAARRAPFLEFRLGVRGVPAWILSLLVQNHGHDGLSGFLGDILC